ncbi:phage late control D family protein [Amorphus sp. MBR-141]
MIRKPVLKVYGASGNDLVPQWGRTLLGVSITDSAGYESDEAVIRFSGGLENPPPKGAPYVIHVGWNDGAPMIGRYTVSRFGGGGDPDSGEEMFIVCRAADFVDKMKRTRSKHYDAAGGLGTAGAIFRALAAEAGVPAAIAPELDQIEIPYRLRWNQTALDFGTDLADDIGAVMKPQAGRLVVLKRGAGKAASEAALPPIRVTRGPSFGWDCDIEERRAVKTTEGGWFDPATGKLVQAPFETGRGAGLALPMHPFASRGEAELGARALAQELGRYSGTASFEAPGDPAAVAGAPVEPSGYGPVVDAIAWEASTVMHDVDPAGDGWSMTIECQTREAS